MASQSSKPEAITLFHHVLTILNKESMLVKWKSLLILPDAVLPQLLPNKCKMTKKCTHSESGTQTRSMFHMDNQLMLMMINSALTHAAATSACVSTCVSLLCLRKLLIMLLTPKNNLRISSKAKEKELLKLVNFSDLSVLLFASLDSMACSLQSSLYWNGFLLLDGSLEDLSVLLLSSLLLLLEELLPAWWSLLHGCSSDHWLVSHSCLPPVPESTLSSSIHGILMRLPWRPTSQRWKEPPRWHLLTQVVELSQRDTNNNNTSKSCEIRHRQEMSIRIAESLRVEVFLTTHWLRPVRNKDIVN